ncbi:MAG: TonB-dependent receptor, partial [Draconibacterium sp.]|nr:TonB-dependent receptor [Draconibacterium sp.]
RNILIKVKRDFPGVSKSEQGQKNIRGKVKNAQGEELPGVTIIVKGTSIGTVTDTDGNFNLNIPANAETLVFSFIGMRTTEVAVGNTTNFDVTLEEETIGIDEVIAIGYGTIRKSDLTGSVTSVKAEALESTGMQSIDQGLVGRAAGVVVTQTSGMPGATASIRIRGTTSLQGGNEPLYVIDGFPVYAGSGFGNTGGRGRISSMATLNPNDIESIEILKDASATSIYGARAANGVVLITTKSGKSGRDQISFDSYYGIQQVTKRIDVLNALEYAELVNEAYVNDGGAPFYDDAQMAEIRQNPEGTNWHDEVFTAAPTQNYQLNISGGDQKTRYAVSGNVLDQDGIIKGSNFKRYSGRINLDRNILNNMKIGSNMTLTRVINDAVQADAHSGVVNAAMKFNPIMGVYEDEELGIYNLVNAPGKLIANPVATAKERILENISTRFLGNTFLEWEFIEGLTAKASFGIDIFNTKSNNFTPSNIYQSGGTASASVSSGLRTTWLNENTLSYLKSFGDHSISAVAGVTFQQSRYESVSGSSQDFVNDVLEENSLESGAVYNAPGSDATEWGIVSYLGRVNYSFKSKYLFSLAGRIDGSSRFGENNKYAVFPSGSFAWRLAEEDFIKDLDIFSNLKLRTSFGFTGNQEIGLYNSLPTLGTTTYELGGNLVKGFRPNKIPNPDLQWEKTAQFDAGLDVGVLDNRLRFTADFYYKKTTDLIYSVAVPWVSGFSTMIQNIGSMQNKGFELEISSDNVKGDFNWTTDFNIAFNRNEVLELGGEEYKDIGSGDGGLKTGPVHRMIVGEPIGTFYGYVFDGIFQNETELEAGPSGTTNWVGGRRYKDFSGPDGVPDGKVDATYDRQIIGNALPDFTGGMTNNFSYKGIDLNVFMQYSVGNDLMNYNRIEGELPSGGQNVYRTMLDRFKPESPSNEYPIATKNRSAVYCDRYIEDGSYFKIKNITLAYNFPGLNAQHIGALKVYCTLQNFFTLTNYTGYDPEVSYRGASNLEIGEDFGTYPQAKTVMFGVKLNIQ